MPIIAVRATQRGYYSVTPGQEIIRNEGEVFDFSTDHCKPVGSIGSGMDPVITIGKKDYLLPFWMERVEDSTATITAADAVPKGHTHRHDKENVI